MTYIPPVNGGRINATISGNTSGAGALISTGTLTLAGGNNITLSQNGNAITISGGAGGAGSNTLGISNLGNTSGSSGVISGSALQYLFAGGNNVTLSQSINAASATVTISAANQTVQTQNLHNMTLAGNTAGVMAQVSSGTLTLAGGNNITLSQNGNAITISGGAGGGGGGVALANSNTTYTSGTVNLLEGGGAITIASTTGQKFNFSVPASSSLAATGIVSLSTSGSTISISAPAFSAGVSTLGNSGGNTGTVSNLLVFAGGNNITLSQSTNAAGATISISGGAGGGAGGVALANSNTTYTSGTVNLLEGGGAITIASTTGQKFNVSVPATSSLIGTNGISVSTNGSSIYVDGTAVAAVTYSYFNPLDAYAQVTGQQGQGTLHIQPVSMPFVSFDRVVFPVVFSGATSITGSATLSMWMGVYTRTSASLSLMTSYSISAGVSHNGTVNSSQNVGLKILTMGASSSLSEGHYYVGILSRTTSATAGSNVSISQIVVSQQNSNFGGFFGQVSTASQQYTRGLGVYSTTTSAIPTSVALSQLNGTASMALRQPTFYVVNSTF